MIAMAVMEDRVWNFARYECLCEGDYFTDYLHVSFMIDMSWTHSFSQECVMSQSSVAGQV